MARAARTRSDAPQLSIPTDAVCFLIVKARQFDVKEEDSDPDSGSNASDDGMSDVLEDDGDDAVEDELTAFIDALDDDEQIDLVALTWLGRGDDVLQNWDVLRQEAARAHNERTARYLLGIPLLSDYLEEALSQFGRSCQDVSLSHL